MLGTSFQRDTETVLSQKLNEMTEEVRRESHKAQTVRQDMEKAKQANGKAEQELAALRQKMQSREAARAQDMDNLTAVQNKLKVGSNTIRRSSVIDTRERLSRFLGSFIYVFFRSGLLNLALKLRSHKDSSV